MIKFGKSHLTLLDCTLRDGGYYTNWDFDESLVNDYLETMNLLPVDYIEIGYRSKMKEEYAGAFYYLPEFILKEIKKKSNKKLAIILNEKEVNVDDLDELLRPCIGLVTMVRLAVDPQNYSRALSLARRVKEFGFLVSFNLMYASKWPSCFQLGDNLRELNTAVDFFYVVDSYGGLYPEEVKNIFQNLKNYLKISLGFHGHNNLEMAMINSLTAVDHGAEIIDFTVLGMGRGAGNLRTELFLTVLNQQNGIANDFDALNSLTTSFNPLLEEYRWGTNLPFMVSGAFSLAQNSVVSRVKKRFYSLNSIVEEVSNGKIPDKINIELKKFQGFESAEKVLVVGGGASAVNFSSALLEYLKANPRIIIVHSSSRNVPVFSNLSNIQIHCLAGNEGKRLEKVLTGNYGTNHSIVLPPNHISEVNYIPLDFCGKIYQLKDFLNIKVCQASATSFAMEITTRLNCKTVLLTGYDGYKGAVTQEELELFEENETIFRNVSTRSKLVSLTPTQYSVGVKSVFAQL